MIVRNATRVLLAMATVALIAEAAMAGVITVNFTGGGATQITDPTAQPGLVSSANIPGGFTNNVVGGGGAVLTGLVDSSGANSGASAVVNAGLNYDSFTMPSTSNAATNTMYVGGLFGAGDGGPHSEVSVTITDIPYAFYDVYVYASADTFSTSTLSSSIGLTTYYYAGDSRYNNVANSLLLTTSTDVLNPTIGPAQYQVFSGLSGSSFTLTTAGSLAFALSANVFGLQIVAIPEIEIAGAGSVLALLGGGLGLLERRRKRA